LETREEYVGNSVAILMRKAPYGSVYTAEGFRTIMGIAVFEMDISVVFMDDGVFALLKDQDPDKFDMKPLGDGFPMLKDFDVENFYVHDVSLSERGLTAEDLVLEAEIVDGAQIAAILENAGTVLPF
jgi:tRNA 2-thiouridine synthesizing protein C